MAKVFIGVPTFNRPQLIRQTVASILAQTFGDFRVVVSDDGSRPATVEEVAGYVASLGDPRVAFHRQPVNGGEYQQGRFFFAASSAEEFFMILHDDDRLDPALLSTGLEQLDRHPGCAFFVANARGLTEDGRICAALTRRHARSIGRIGARDGVFDVLERHLACGFAPISGTLFRRDALVRSGFVDDDCHGNYPFECNIFLRLGEAGSQAVFSSRELLDVRYHRGALRQRRELEIAEMNETCIRLWSRRRFRGALERRRRAILARYYRAQAMIAARRGAVAEARTNLAQGLRTFPGSPRSWALAPVLWLAPGLLRRPRRLEES